ncbi:efflux RND transporter periplasmic adaptor subunit [Anaerosacchariphilus polymeriproducens]|uniref:Efflux RND transporter periplasmic adaptor subunit n=1 Tax=Anaerosacchariphilus polymeriproducens TaxID=1812858 RepID=A0A371AWI3_9FIRM|nr:efflux RND transporter periplasmic adaptor subunit [Anaerosacchariphilus polymeriproducens]RDU23938.1 efflux RND transporter periplasmic adaptor subunit [Anaerosacchariphilus polymeriproducens]
MKKKLSKKVKIISAVVIIVLIIAGIGIWYAFSGFGVSEEDKVYVESVAEVAGLTGVNGSQNRYSGVVEAQETYKIEKDADTKVKDVLVKVGDTVKVGQELFTYDVDQLQTQIDTKKLDIEKMQSEISGKYNEIKGYENDRASATADDKFQITVSINSAKTEIKQKEFDIKKAQKELENLEKKIQTSSKKSEVEGVVKSINNTENTDVSDESEDLPMDTQDGSGSAFMTILATGNYRVKGIISEQTAQSLGEGSEVIIRSRIDEHATWKGTINKVDLENKVQSNTDQFSDESSSANTATKVPFYITLENSKGLMMGQHVFVELDQGQNENQEGIWLTENYIIQEGETAFVWVSNKHKKLEKRTVTLGEYNEELAKYQIKEGLTEDDYIAFPREEFKEGMLTTTEKAEEAEAEEEIPDDMIQSQDFEGAETEIPDGEEALTDDAAMKDESMPAEGEDTEETDSAEVEE